MESNNSNLHPFHAPREVNNNTVCLYDPSIKCQMLKRDTRHSQIVRLSTIVTFAPNHLVKLDEGPFIVFCALDSFVPLSLTFVPSEVPGRQSLESRSLTAKRVSSPYEACVMLCRIDIKHEEF